MTIKQVKKWQVYIILIVGIIAVSTSAIWIRLCLEVIDDNGIGISLFIASSRLILSSFILICSYSLSFFKTQFNYKDNILIKIKNKPKKKAYYLAIASGICLGLHFASWITSLSFISITAATVLVNTNSLWIALLSWFFYKEKLSKSISIGIFIAFIGSIIITLSGDHNNVNYSNLSLLGNILALLGAILVSCYLLLGKESQNQGLSLNKYIAIAYTTGALFLFPFPILLRINYLNQPLLVYIYLIAMALICQLIGHTTINWSMLHISPTIVSLFILFEPLGASFLGFLSFREVPSIYLVIGGIFVLMGVAISLKNKNK